MDFDAFINDIVTNGWNVFGVEVYENNVLTHAWGDTEENLHDIYSATKTIQSIAVGIAYDRGLIDFDRCILDYLPEEYVQAMDETAKKAYEKIAGEAVLAANFRRKTAELVRETEAFTSGTGHRPARLYTKA